MIRKEDDDQKSELFFENVLSQLADYICIWNCNKQCVYANGKLEALWGYPRGDYMWRTPLQLGFSRAGSELFEGMIEEVIRLGEAKIGSFPYLGVTNSLRHYQCIFNPIFDENGDVEFVACVSRDITELKQAEEELRESQRQYQLLFESLEEAYCLLEVIYDRESQEPVDFMVLRVNPAFQKHTGIIDVVGKSTKDIVPGLEDKWVDLWKRVAKSGRSACIVDESAALGRWFDACVYSLEGANSSKIVLLFYDITRFVL